MGITLDLEYMPDATTDEDTTNRSLVLFPRKNYGLPMPDHTVVIKGLAPVRGDRSKYTKELTKRFIKTCLRHAAAGDG